MNEKVVYWHQTPDGLNLMRLSNEYLYTRTFNIL